LPEVGGLLDQNAGIVQLLAVFDLAHGRAAMTEGVVPDYE
jgi:hypothetical protein